MGTTMRRPRNSPARKARMTVALPSITVLDPHPALERGVGPALHLPICSPFDERACGASTTSLKSFATACGV
jgi:hypothetical protein